MIYPDWWKRAEPSIHEEIGEFSNWIQAKVGAIQPHQLIVKNPYLFRARAPESAEQLASRFIDAFLSSSEETRFGDILEGAVISICKEAKGGWKSSADGIDLEYDENNIRTIVQIKSGVKWGNSSQRKKLVTDFQSATRTLRQGKNVQVRCVEGVCYGPSGIKDFGSHIRLVGNEFWYDISGWVDTGRAVLEIVDQHASNGLTDAIYAARNNVVDYLERSGVARSQEPRRSSPDLSIQNNLDWSRLYDLIMMPTKDRPK
ncbi:MAG: PmeII family type II restriction endonuclease [Aestuariivita sp.]|nr:PmeII family type II restriction endonuclease [Aestuariivita sp.]